MPRGGGSGLRRAGRDQRDRGAGGGGDSGDRARPRPVVRGRHRPPAADGEAPDLRGLVAVDTLVILMGRAVLGAIAEQLVGAGRDPDTPAACIQNATMPGQRVTRATLATIAAAADRDGLEHPVVTVIGAVAALADTEIAAVSGGPALAAVAGG